MSVVVTESCRVYWNHQVQDLSKGSIVHDPEFANYLLSIGLPVDDYVEGPAVDTDGDGVPEGNVEQVLSWVGGDRDRAVAAFNAEADRGDKARKTLLAELEKRASADGQAQ